MTDECLAKIREWASGRFGSVDRRTVLALLDEIERLKKELRNALEHIDDWEGRNGT